MPSRIRVARELAEIFKLMAHPDRVRLIAELRSGEKDVNGLAEVLALSAPRVSQHLSLFRAHRLVEERRDGRRRFYQLTAPDIADWVIDGLAFIELRTQSIPEGEVDVARRLWTATPDPL